MIKEGRQNPDLLFLGTEFSLWVSIDRGQSWSRYQEWAISEYDRGYFPTVAVHDLESHPRELDLIIGTHGRSIWTLPIRALEELTAEHRQQDVYFVNPGNVYLFPTPGAEKQSEIRELLWTSPNTQPGTLFAYHLKQAATGEATIRITDAAGQEVYAELTGPAQAGLKRRPLAPQLGPATHPSARGLPRGADHRREGVRPNPARRGRLGRGRSHRAAPRVPCQRRREAAGVMIGAGVAAGSSISWAISTPCRSPAARRGD